MNPENHWILVNTPVFNLLWDSSVWGASLVSRLSRSIMRVARENFRTLSNIFVGRALMYSTSRVRDYNLEPRYEHQNQYRIVGFKDS